MYLCIYVATNDDRNIDCIARNVDKASITQQCQGPIVDKITNEYNSGSGNDLMCR